MPAPLPSGNPNGPIIPPALSNWWNGLPWANQMQWAPEQGDPYINPLDIGGEAGIGYTPPIYNSNNTAGTKSGGVTNVNPPGGGVVIEPPAVPPPYSNFGGVVTGQRSPVGNTAFDSHAANLALMAAQTYGGAPNLAQPDQIGYKGDITDEMEAAWRAADALRYQSEKGLTDAQLNDLKQQQMLAATNQFQNMQMVNGKILGQSPVNGLEPFGWLNASDNSTPAEPALPSWLFGA